MGQHLRLAQIFVALGRELAGRQSADEVLRTVTRRAFEVIPAAEHAAISRGRQGRFETVFPTSELPPLVDQIQYDLGHGPCVDVAVHGSAQRVADLARTRAWPEFGAAAVRQYGIRSMLSVRLYLEESDLVAGLNLYSSAVDAFDESDETTAVLLATHGALAVNAAERQTKIDNLERALRTSRRIGMAVGIVMATNKLTEGQAFDLLRIASQNRHRKLFELADQVVETGMLDLPLPPDERRRG